MAVLKILNKIQVFLFDFFNNVTGVVLTIILGSVIAGIVSRYIFNSPFIWTEELCTVMLVYLGFCSAPMATIAQEHIVADFFKNLLPPKYNKALSIIIRLVSIAFFIILAISCIHYIPGRTYKTPTLYIPRYAFYIPVLVSTIAMSYSLCVHMINDFFPGYDYFKQRQAARDEAQKLIEEEENIEQEARMDAFMKHAKETRHDGGQV